MIHHNSFNFKFKVKFNFNNGPPQTHVSKYECVLHSYASVCVYVCVYVCV